jgi:hypothetical protein
LCPHRPITHLENKAGHFTFSFALVEAIKQYTETRPAAVQPRTSLLIRTLFNDTEERANNTSGYQKEVLFCNYKAQLDSGEGITVLRLRCRGVKWLSFS